MAAVHNREGRWQGSEGPGHMASTVRKWRDEGWCSVQQPSQRDGATHTQGVLPTSASLTQTAAHNHGQRMAPHAIPELSIASRSRFRCLRLSQLQSFSETRIWGWEVSQGHQNGVSVWEVPHELYLFFFLVNVCVCARATAHVNVSVLAHVCMGVQKPGDNCVCDFPCAIHCLF